MILRGIKRVEYRSRTTRIIGERFLIYASKGKVQRPETRSQQSDGHDGRRTSDRRTLTSDNLSAATLPAWMIELAEQVRMIEPGALLPTGLIVGSAVIERVVQRSEVRDQSSANTILSSDLGPPTSIYEWQLKDVKRFTRPRKPTGHPQPVWFRPF